MKRYYLLLLFVTSWINGQVISFTDVNFKNKLLASSTSTTNIIAKDIYGFPLKIDANSNGEIEQSEASAVYYLNVRNSNIHSLIGLQFFTNLKVLFCDYNPLLTSLNTSGLTELQKLFAGACNLESVNLSSSSNIEILDISGNNLAALNVSNMLFLKELTFSDNNITTIDLVGLTNLTHLTSDFNLLTSLTVNNLINLERLTCSNNLLSELNISNLSNLEFLRFGNPNLNPVNVSLLTNLKWLYFKGGMQTSIDISNLSNLISADFRNSNFIELDASNNINLTTFTIEGDDTVEYLNLKNGNPGMDVYADGSNLQSICVNEEDLDAVYESLTEIGITDVVVTSYCSFTPGGNYNTITGSMLFDSNNNGCDTSDLPQPNIKITISDGTNQGATFTNNSGDYNFFTQTGSFEITPSVENTSYFNFSPISATIPFADNNDNTVTQNFCITPNGVHSDLEVVIVPIIAARPGFDAVYKIVYKNKGNQTDTGYVNFTYNDAVLDFVSSSIVPNNNGGGFMNWIIPNIAPFQSGSILVTLNVNSPQETPSVNIGDILAFNAFIDVSTDDIWADNNFDFNQTVVGSYDPNDITCLQGNALPTTEMGEFLHYNIRFENTGTYAAENIVVKNEIDLTQYNIQSLQVMESSHPVEIRVTGNIAEFIFQNIDLDTGGHGNILLKLKSNTTLSNDLVINSADIFFDYNFPIITNDEQTVFANLSKNDFVKDVSIQVYPNPVNDIINVKADNTINSIQLYDAQGRLLLTKMANENTQVLDLSSYSSGIYFINISTSVGKQTQKIIKN